MSLYLLISLVLCVGGFNIMSLVFQSLIWLVILNLSCAGVIQKEELSLLRGVKGNVLQWGAWDFPLRILVTSDVEDYMYDIVVQESIYISNIVSCNLFTAGRIDKNDFRVVVPQHRDVILHHNLANGMGHGEASIYENSIKPYFYAFDVAINPSLNKEDTKKVIRHELLHVLGLAHDFSKTSIMYKHSTISEGNIESIDVDYLRKQCF